MTHRALNIAIAGGGTGGHLFPALAVGEVLLDRGHQVLIFISEKEVDALATRGRTEFRFEKLPSVGMPKLLSPAIFRFFRQFNASLAPCRRVFGEFQPDAVLGMGGFTSTPPILAGKMRGVPTFVHESNAIPGKANRLNARLVDRVLLGFEECARYFPAGKCTATGTPVRRSLLERLPRKAALATFGLEEGRTTIAVMGGSQGAHGVNEAVRRSLGRFGGVGVQFIHLSGPQDEDALRAAYTAAGVPAYVAPFCHQMEAVYSAADLAVARSGAASLSEIAHYGIPSLLIPYPFAAENHQQFNAEIFARAGAATVLKEAEITGDTLGGVICNLVGDAGPLAAMAARCRALAPADAAAQVADVVEAAARKRLRG